MYIKIGVIGTGAIGEDHVRRINEVIKGAMVSAVTDINEKRAREIADKYGAVFYKTAEELIWSDDVDAVVIASSDPTHAQYTLECIKANKYVLCEKPLGTSKEECKQVVDTEIANGKQLVQVGFMRRFDRGYRKLKEVIDSGQIGKPLIVHCCHRNKVPGPGHTTDMTIKNSGIHEIDVLRWLLGEDYVSGQVIMPRQNEEAGEGLKDPQIMLLTTESGVAIDVEVNMNSAYGYDIQCEVVCEKGVVRLPDPDTVIMKKSGLYSYEIYEDWSLRFIEAYDIELQEWVDNVKKSKVVGPTAWDGYVACVVADALIDARKQARQESILIEPQPEFYK